MLIRWRARGALQIPPAKTSNSDRRAFEELITVHHFVLARIKRTPVAAFWVF